MSSKAKEYDAKFLRDRVSSPPLPWCSFHCLSGLRRMFASASTRFTPSSMQIMDLTFSFCKTRMLFVASQLNVAEILADGPQTAREIAAKIQGTGPIRVTHLERLLSALASISVFQANYKDGVLLFSNNETSALLRHDHPNTMKPLLTMVVTDCYDSWNYLEDSIRGTVSKAWDKSLQAQQLGEAPERSNLWTWYEKHPDRQAVFNRAMVSFASLADVAMVFDGPFAGARRIVDIGGGLGHFLICVLRHNPKLKGLLFDLPAVIEQAMRQMQQESHDEPYSRVRFCAGSFLESSSLPPFLDGDCLVLRAILHDWPDEQATGILRNLRTVAGQRQISLLLGECILPDVPTSSEAKPIMRVLDLHLGVLCAGQVRSLTSWSDLLQRSGWELVQAHKTRSMLSWIKAVPKP